MPQCVRGCLAERATLNFRQVRIYGGGFRQNDDAMGISDILSARHRQAENIMPGGGKGIGGPVKLIGDCRVEQFGPVQLDGNPQSVGCGFYLWIAAEERCATAFEDAEVGGDDADMVELRGQREDPVV